MKSAAASEVRTDQQPMYMYYVQYTSEYLPNILTNIICIMIFTWNWVLCAHELLVSNQYSLDTWRWGRGEQGRRSVWLLDALWRNPRCVLYYTFATWYNIYVRTCKPYTLCVWFFNVSWFIIYHFRVKSFRPWVIWFQLVLWNVLPRDWATCSVCVSLWLF